MRNLLLLALAGAFWDQREATEHSAAYDDGSPPLALTNASYDEAQGGYSQARLKGFVRARPHQSRSRTHSLWEPGLGVVFVSLVVTYLVLRCSMMIKSKASIAATARRAAEGGDSCLVSGGGAPTT